MLYLVTIEVRFFKIVLVDRLLNLLFFFVGQAEIVSDILSPRYLFQLALELLK